MLSIYLLSNQNPYIIDIEISIQKNLKISGNQAVIDFGGLGSIGLQGKFTVAFEGLIIKKSTVDDQSDNFALNLMGLSLINLTVFTFFTFFIFYYLDIFYFSSCCLQKLFAYN